MFAAALIRQEWICNLAVKNALSLVAIGLLAGAVTAFPSAYEIVPLLLLTGFFVIIAAGNTLFGVLKNPISRTLGEFAYSIYLMHGLLLFIAFNFILGPKYSSSLSVAQHWLVVISITPVLIITCFLTYRFVEFPAMQKTVGVTTWLRLITRSWVSPARSAS